MAHLALLLTFVLVTLSTSSFASQFTVWQTPNFKTIGTEIMVASCGCNHFHISVGSAKWDGRGKLGRVYNGPNCGRGGPPVATFPPDAKLEFNTPKPWKSLAIVC